MKDYFGRDASSLICKKLWLFDMDGTIYEEDRVFDGTKVLLNKIVDMGGRYVFITNNSSKSCDDYIEKVNRLGIPAKIENFFTSSQATILYLNQNYPGAKVYCQGTRSLLNELKNAGILVTEEVESVDVVVIGFDTELTTEKLRKTCEILSTQDVAYIATNPDWVCPVSFGFVPDCGSICSMIKNATGKWPVFIGKPEPTMVNIVREKYEASADETVVIGDRLYTDIATGLNAGVTAVCVLTGEATVKDIEDGEIKPSLTLNSVRDIYEILSTPYQDAVYAPYTLSNETIKSIVREDIMRCESVLGSGNERYAETLYSALVAKYNVPCIDADTWLNKLKILMCGLLQSMR